MISKPAIWSEIRAILFDKDGTLLSFGESWAPVYRTAAAMAARGDTRLASSILAATGMDAGSGIIEHDSLLAAGNTAEIAQAWIEAGAPCSLKDLVGDLDELFVRASGDTVAATDLLALFRSLSGAGLTLGIASSDNQAAIWATVDRFSLRPYVSFVAGYDSGLGIKPDAGMLLAFCRATRLQPGQIAVVGDSLHDMAMARSGGAGLAIAVTETADARGALIEASDMNIANVEELIALVGIS